MDLPLQIAVNPGLDNTVSVDPCSAGHLARLSGAGDEISWQITGGTPTGPADERDLSFSAAGAEPGSWLELTASAVVDREIVEASQRVMVDHLDTAQGPWDEAVAVVRANGLMEPCSDGPLSSWCPEEPVLRKDLPHWLLIALEGPGYEPPRCTGEIFLDVDPSDKHCDWIEDLARRGVVTGCSPGRYCPEDPVTREQAAVFFLATLEGPGYLPQVWSSSYADLPSSSPYSRWVEELTFRGIGAGCGHGVYCPQDPLAREQAAAFLVESFGLSFD